MLCYLWSTLREYVDICTVLLCVHSNLLDASDITPLDMTFYPPDSPLSAERQDLTFLSISTAVG